MLSTLHTNDAAGAVVRLKDMGVEPFLLASSVNLAQAQRLYRKLCPFCKKETKLPLEVLKANSIDPAFFEGTIIFSPVGCPKCNGTGFKGRSAIMEVLPVDETSGMPFCRARAATIRIIATGKGMATLENRRTPEGQRWCDLD